MTKHQKYSPRVNFTQAGPIGKGRTPRPYKQNSIPALIVALVAIALLWAMAAQVTGTINFMELIP